MNVSACVRCARAVFLTFAVALASSVQASTGGGLTDGVNGNIVGINNPLVSATGNFGGTAAV